MSGRKMSRSDPIPFDSAAHLELGSGLCSELGLVRLSSQGSGLVSQGLTQGSFLGLRHEDSARLCSRLVSVCSRSGSARVSAYHRSGIRLSATRLDSLFGARLISARSSGSAWD